jgi:hypothetical protein
LTRGRVQAAPAETDDATPSSLITYRVLVNGAIDHVVVGGGSTVLYAATGGSSTIEVIAVDESATRPRRPH